MAANKLPQPIPFVAVDDIAEVAEWLRQDAAETDARWVERLAHYFAALRSDPARVAEEMEARLDDCEEALHRIREWSEAYPLTVFPEPDLKKARALLEAGGMTLDSISADCMRHVVKGVGQIARAALRADPLPQETGGEG